MTERILVRGEERGGERGYAPATDERRGHASKGARPFGVALSRPVDVVAMLARATSPRGAPLLATERLSAIMTGLPMREGL